MTYVTGMIGDRAYTLTLGAGGGIQGDENMLKAFEGVNAYDEATALDHCRKLFGDTMQVRDDSPAVIPGPFLADNPAKGGDPAMMGAGGILHREDVVVPPGAPGSASMASTAENTPAAGATATPPVPPATPAPGKK